MLMLDDYIFFNVMKKIKTTFFIFRNVYLRCVGDIYFNFFFDNNYRVDNKKIIVSVASWKKRVNDIYPSLESLFDQRFKPDKIILWLDFNCRDCLPIEVKTLVRRGLEIRYVENIGSYKKLIPVLDEFPNDVIITLDDDIVYPKTVLSRLYASYCRYPTYIHANIAKDVSDLLTNASTYCESKAIRSIDECIGRELLPIGVGGVLYPCKNVFYKDLSDKQLFLQLAPKQDDLWFWFMARLEGSMFCKIKYSINDLLDYELEDTKKSALYCDNILDNDIAIQAIVNNYKELNR